MRTLSAIAPVAAISTPGSSGETRLASTMTRAAPTANATAPRCQDPGPRSASHPLASGLAEVDRVPSVAGNCEAMMSTVAAVVKPSSTGWDIRYASDPPLTIPSSRRHPPTRTASSAARPTYSDPPIGAKGLSAPSTNSDVMAVGPVCRYGEEAANDAAMGASAAAYRPRSGGSPASWAYASDCGTRTNATLMPAPSSRAPGPSQTRPRRPGLPGPDRGGPAPTTP